MHKIVTNIDCFSITLEKFVSNLTIWALSCRFIFTIFFLLKRNPSLHAGLKYIDKVFLEGKIAAFYVSTRLIGGGICSCLTRLKILGIL